MALLSAVQEEYLRDHLGTAVDLGDAQDRYNRLNDVDAVIVEVLRRRIADLEATPAQFSVAGEYSQNTSENLKSLTAKLGEFQAGKDTGLSVVRTVQPARAPYR